MAGKVTCEHCGGDLTTANYDEDERLVLRSERIPAGEGAVMAMSGAHGLDDRPYHFCNFVCLACWAGRE